MNKIKSSFTIVSILLLVGCAAGPLSPQSGSSSSAPTPASMLPAPIAHLQAAQEANPDTVAWLTVPGTNIDGPVQQANDNDYYMRRDALGEPNQEGCFFADYECSFGGLDAISPNTVVYGHTFTKKGQDPNIGFGQLHKLLDPDFSAQHSEIQLTFQGQTLVFKILSVGYADAENDLACIKAYPTQQEHQQILTLAQERNVLAVDIPSITQNNILTLSTCTNDSEQRLLVVAVLEQIV